MLFFAYWQACKGTCFPDGYEKPSEAAACAGTPCASFTGLPVEVVWRRVCVCSVQCVCVCVCVCGEVGNGGGGGGGGELVFINI